VEAGLIDKYGTQTENRSSIPSTCAELAACVVSQNASVSFLWSWRSRQSVELRVGACDTPDACRVVLVYNALTQSPTNGL